MHGMVFYQSSPYSRRIADRLQVFNRALESCARNKITLTAEGKAEAIDLNLLARCVFLESGYQLSAMGFVKFRGMAAVPSYISEADNPHFGLYDHDGYLLINYISVNVEAFTTLMGARIPNTATVRIYFITAVGSGLDY